MWHSKSLILKSPFWHAFPLESKYVIIPGGVYCTSSLVMSLKCPLVSKFSLHSKEWSKLYSVSQKKSFLWQQHGTHLSVSALNRMLELLPWAFTWYSGVSWRQTATSSFLPLVLLFFKTLDIIVWWWHHWLLDSKCSFSVGREFWSDGHAELMDFILRLVR